MPTVPFDSALSFFEVNKRLYVSGEKYCFTFDGSMCVCFMLSVKMISLASITDFMFTSDFNTRNIQLSIAGNKINSKIQANCEGN